MFEHDITEYAKDGRLCGPNDGKKYRMRELIDEVKWLGRPLTEKEAIRFERSLLEQSENEREKYIINYKSISCKKRRI